jgi:hypothetical protein
MGTRSERIRGRDLPQQAERLLHQTVQLITWSGHSYLAKVVAVAPGHITLRDLNAYWYNRRKHTHHIPWEEVREVLIDRPSAW